MRAKLRKAKSPRIQLRCRSCHYIWMPKKQKKQQTRYCPRCRHRNVGWEVVNAFTFMREKLHGNDTQVNLETHTLDELRRKLKGSN